MSSCAEPRPLLSIGCSSELPTLSVRAAKGYPHNRSEVTFLSLVLRFLIVHDSMPGGLWGTHKRHLNHGSHVGGRTQDFGAK